MKIMKTNLAGEITTTSATNNFWYYFKTAIFRRVAGKNWKNDELSFIEN